MACHGMATLLLTYLYAHEKRSSSLQNMYNHVREDHHLRHGGRMQLGLFLKVSTALFIDDAINSCPHSGFARAEKPETLSLLILQEVAIISYHE